MIRGQRRGLEAALDAAAVGGLDQAGDDMRAQQRLHDGEQENEAAHHWLLPPGTRGPVRCITMLIVPLSGWWIV
jgi:hypothetical protein